MHCQAATAAEAEQWMATLKKFRDRALSATNALVDYVARENAEAAICQLHSAIKNSGLFQIITRLSSSVNAEEGDRLRHAFWVLREHQLNTTLRKEQEQFKKGLEMAEQEVKVAKQAGSIQEAAAKRLAKLGLLLQRLSMLADSKRHLAFIEFKKKVDLLHTEKTAKDVKEIMVNALIVEHSHSANQQLQWRRRRIAFALRRPVTRMIAEAFMTIKTRGQIIQTAEKMRRYAMLNLFSLKASQDRLTLASAVPKWKGIINLQQRQEEGMKALFLSRKRWDLHLALRRWNASCIIRNQKDIRACRIIQSAIQRHEQKLIR